MRNKGFTLVEVAVVMVILAVLLGSLIGPMSTQRELKREKQTAALLKEINDALMGFAAINGRLPCPATNASSGDAAPNSATTTCTAAHGFIPGRTLGLQGTVDANNILVDAWHNPILYSLTTGSGGAFSNNITLGLTPDFQVCEQSACTTIIASNVVAVIVSTGEDGSLTTTSPDQLENADSDVTFVQRNFAETSGSEFNDQLSWISPNTLILNLVKAGRLN